MSNNTGLFFAGTSVAPPDAITVSYMTFITSGVIGMTILFTCLYSGQNLQFDKQYGLMKTIVVSPMPRSQILIGTTLSGITKCLIQTTIITLFGYILGAQLFAGFLLSNIITSAIGLILFSILFSAGLMFLSNMIGLKVNNHDVSQAIMALLTLPLFFASNALYPAETLPFTMKLLCYVNPLAYFIDSVRYFTIGPNFYAFGFNYQIGLEGLLSSFIALGIFALVMFVLAIFVIKNIRDF